MSTNIRESSNDLTEQISFDYFEKNNYSNLNIDSKDYEGNSFINVKNIVPKKNYKVLELFAGAGGMALGLENAGFESAALIEIDKPACNTLIKTRPNWKVLNEDIITVAELGISNYIDTSEIDVLSGGYPCQSFSYAGKKLGLDDTRGTLFYYYAKILKDIMPKVFIAENVKGLVNHDNGQTLNIMIKVFEDLGYEVQWNVLRAIDYGVAQKRERIFIIGVRSDLVKKHKVKYSFPEVFDYSLTLKDVLQNVPTSPGAQYPESKKRVLKLVPPGGYWRDLPENIAKEYMGKSYYSGGGRTGMARRLSWDEPSLTLTCSPAQKQTERCHPDEIRPFTVREYARIQSFPDEWEFPVSMSNAYKQIGNAVPVKLAEVIGLSVIELLNRIE